ncbi:MAG: cytochrome c peroxidase [Bacteroidota bacterium]
MRKWGYLGLGWVFIWGLSACGENEGINPVNSDIYEIDLPDHFPSLEFFIPEDNPLTNSKVELGKKLFFDANLSSDGTISCASCHKPELAFTDGRSLSIGVQGRLGKRNAPSLANAVFGQSFFWHGSIPTLEQQAIFPLEDPNEMDNNFTEIIRRVNGDSAYQLAFTQVFGSEATPAFVTDALASFQRALLSYESPYDKFLQGDSSALTPSQHRGLTLFNGETAECFHCHNPSYNFTDESFRNNGLYEVYSDPGRWEVTGLESDKGKFKVPTLRNISLTAPYMHDGSLPDLEAVLDHYMSGGKAHPNKSGEIRRFVLSEGQKQDLLNFLESLTDPSFINNPLFRND